VQTTKRREEELEHSNPMEGHKDVRKKELEAFFGTSLESFPAIADRFQCKNSEHVIDNAIIWLTMRESEKESTAEREPQAASPNREQGAKKAGACKVEKKEEEEGSNPTEEMERLANERRNKVMLLRRIETIVGLGKDPLRELLAQGGFRVFSSDVSLRREDLEWLTRRYDEIKAAFLISTFSKKVCFLLLSL